MSLVINKLVLIRKFSIELATNRGDTASLCGLHVCTHHLQHSPESVGLVLLPHIAGQSGSPTADS